MLRGVLERRCDMALLAYWPRAFRGDWRDVPPGDGAELLMRVTLTLAGAKDAQPWPMMHEAWAGRSLALQSYGDQGVTFYDILLRDIMGQVARAAFLTCDDRIVLLDNSSAPLHDFNFSHPPRFDEPEAAAEYLRLFCWTICGDSGPFQIVEDAFALPFELPQAALDDSASAPLPLAPRRPPPPEPAAAGDPEDEVAPPTAEELRAMTMDERAERFARLDAQNERNRPQPRWLATAAVQYDTALFRAEFGLYANGMVEMLDDDVCSQFLRHGVWRLAPPLRYHLPAEYDEEA